MLDNFCDWPVPKHFTQHSRCNLSTYWHSMDSKEAFYKRSKGRQYYKIQSLNGDTITWQYNDIIYSFNNYGFRCNDFDPSLDNIITIGCSFTEGVGLNLEQTWTAKVANELNLENYNLALAGQGWEYCYSMLDVWIPFLKPKYVFCLVPYPFRYTYRLPDSIQCQTFETVFGRQLDKLAYRGDRNDYVPSMANYRTLNGQWFADLHERAIQNLTYRYSVPIYTIAISHAMPYMKQNELWDLARDQSHYCEDYHNLLANKMLEKVK